MATVSTESPTIVIGCNHSGTRAVVEVLDTLGSDSGPADNHWREHSGFLELHQRVLTHEFGSDAWHRPDLFRQIRLAEDQFSSLAKEAIELSMGMGDRAAGDRWHWKSPRTIFLMEYWRRIFPKAVFVHIIRDGRDVACGLYRANDRQTIPSRQMALEYWEAYVSLLLQLQPPDCLVIRYESLSDEVEGIATRLGIHDPALVSRGRRAVRPNSGAWRREFPDAPQAGLLTRLGYRREDR